MKSRNGGQAIPVSSTNWVGTTFFVLMYVGIVGFLGTYFLFSTHQFQSWLVPRSEFLSHAGDLLLFGFLVGAAACFGLGRFFNAVDNTPSVKPAPRRAATFPKYFSYVQLFFSAVIVGQAFISLTGTLAIDEYVVSHRLADATVLEMLNPFRPLTLLRFSDNQFIANVLSHFSVKWFGLSIWAMRLPSFAVTILLVVFLYFFCRRYLMPLSSLLVYAQLSANGLFVFFSVANKGYISMIFFSLWLYATLIHFTSHKIQNERRFIAGFVVSFLLTGLTHTMACLFCIVAFLALIAWLNINMSALSSAKRQLGAKLLWACLFLTPILFFILIAHLKTLAAYGDVFGTLADRPVEIWGGLFGFSRLMWSKVIWLFFLILLAEQVRAQGLEAIKPFPTIFLGLSILFVVGLLLSAGARFLSPRFFLAFYLPILFWMGDSVSRLRLKRAKIYVAMLAVLSISPLFFRTEMRLMQTPYLEKPTAFIKNVLLQTQDKPGICYELTGDDTGIDLAKTFYMPSSDHACKHRFFLFFDPSLSTSLFRAPAGVTRPDQGARPYQFTEIFRDPSGNTLYRQNFR